jgi:hypothetical protein
MKKFLLLLTALALLGFTNVFAQNLKSNHPTFVIDGLVLNAMPDSEKLNPNSIEALNVLKGEKATTKYAKFGENGVIEIQTKKNVYTGWKSVANEHSSFLKLNPTSLIILNGKRLEADKLGQILNLKSKDIISSQTLSAKEGAERYGEGGERGVILINAKNNE